MFKSLKGVLATAAFLSSISAALSHAVVSVPLPTHHATVLAAKLVPHLVSAHSTSLTALQLESLLKKGSGSYFLGSSTLALSGSQRALASSLKLTSETSINSSINLSNLSSGQFYATQYVGTGNILANDGLTFRAFGSNPFNTANPPSNASTSTIQSIFLSASHQGVVSTSTSALLLSKVNPIQLSAGARRVANLYGAVASKGAQIGSYISSHPTGGILYGSFYAGNTLLYQERIALAFGNNVYNTSPTVSIPYLSNGSYILFGNKVLRAVSSGQFFGTEYFAPPTYNPLIPGSQFLYVFGNNPLNVIGHSPILASAFASYFRF